MATKSVLKKISNELKHYISGTKLLGYEVRVSFGLFVRLVKGAELSRREMIQLKRTTGDIFRMVPFSAFIIIPFGELLLPFVIKFAPNFLPSTYEKKEDKLIRRNKLEDRRQVASKLLRNALKASSVFELEEDKRLQANRETFNIFFYKLKLIELENPDLRSKAYLFTNNEIFNAAKLFEDNLVLDNLSRSQLIAIVKFMSIRPFGTDAFLRYLIRQKLQSIINDDKKIYKEGISALNNDELYQACIARGMHVYSKDVSKLDLILNLNIWLYLRITEHVPIVLLILSSGITYDKCTDVIEFEALKRLYVNSIFQVLCSLSDNIYDIVKMTFLNDKGKKSQRKNKNIVTKQKEYEGDIDKNALKLRVLKTQEFLIFQERKQEQERFKSIKRKVQIRDNLNIRENTDVLLPIRKDDAPIFSITKINKNK